jgi:hypothetical protein
VCGGGGRGRRRGSTQERLLEEVIEGKPFEFGNKADKERRGKRRRKGYIPANIDEE